MTEILTSTEVNCLTQEVTVRNLTAEEVAELELERAAAIAEQEAREAAAAAETAAKESAAAKLAAIGLTSDEVAAIIGR
jgi:FMN-dependent NADH-azoreductase